MKTTFICAHDLEALHKWWEDNTRGSVLSIEEKTHAQAAVEFITFLEELGTWIESQGVEPRAFTPVISKVWVLDSKHEPTEAQVFLVRRHPNKVFTAEEVA